LTLQGNIRVALFVLGLAVALMAGSASPASAAPQPFNGYMSFVPIRSPSDREDFEFEVELGEEQELRPVDEQDVDVFYSDGHRAFSIAADPAHDADGAAVPTTIAQTGPNIITYTVHHRAGNPAASWAPFDYPIAEGAGWEGGFSTTVAQMPPPTPIGGTPTPPPPTCLVPKLRGYSLAVDRRRLRAAHCSLGPVRGRRSKGAKVVEQYRHPGQTLPADTPVGVRL
jgi:hypothetical protein